jgi:hypothetical protein
LRAAIQTVTDPGDDIGDSGETTGTGIEMPRAYKRNSPVARI